jgi:hypothetical protein
MEEQKTKKTRVDYNHTYYMNHKAENDKRQLLSLIRTKGRVPHLHTVQRRNINIKELTDAWAAYKNRMEGKEIPPNKIAEMRVLVANMI